MWHIEPNSTHLDGGADWCGLSPPSWAARAGGGEGQVKTGWEPTGAVYHRRRAVTYEGAARAGDGKRRGRTGADWCGISPPLCSNI